MKSLGLTEELQLKLLLLSAGEESGIPSVAVKCVDIRRNTSGEGDFLDSIGGTPVAKATFWTITDVEARKCGEQTGLDTLVVHTVNDGY